MEDFKKIIGDGYGCAVIIAGSDSDIDHVGNPANVGKAIAQMYCDINPSYKNLLKQFASEKIAKLEEADVECGKGHWSDGGR